MFVGACLCQCGGTCLRGSKTWGILRRDLVWPVSVRRCTCIVRARAGTSGSDVQSLCCITYPSTLSPTPTPRRRYLTDIAFGNRHGMLTVHVQPLTTSGEPFGVVMVRGSGQNDSGWWVGGWFRYIGDSSRSEAASRYGGTPSASCPMPVQSGGQLRRVGPLEAAALPFVVGQVVSVCRQKAGVTCPSLTVTCPTNSIGRMEVG